jgi:hypothetical protein
LDVDICHHAAVLVIQDVAVIHESARDAMLEEWHDELDFAWTAVCGERYIDGVHHLADVVPFTVASGDPMAPQAAPTLRSFDASSRNLILLDPPGTA